MKTRCTVFLAILLSIVLSRDAIIPVNRTNGQCEIDMQHVNVSRYPPTEPRCQDPRGLGKGHHACYELDRSRWRRHDKQGGGLLGRDTSGKPGRYDHV